MQCKHCGKQLEEGWAFCPFCRTAVPGEEQRETVQVHQERAQECRADCYEEYESLSPLPPAVRQAYEESRQEEEARLLPVQEDETSEAEKNKEAVFQGTKALRAFAAAGTAVSLVPVLFCVFFFVLFCRNFISAEGLFDALGEAWDSLIYYFPDLLITIGVGSMLGVVMAWVRLRRVPVLHVMLAAVMSFVGKIPVPLCVMLPGAVCYTVGYLKRGEFYVPVTVMLCALGVMGGVYTGDAFYRRGQEKSVKWQEPVALSEFIRFLWRQGTPDFGRVARRLYYSILIATRLFMRVVWYWAYENSGHYEDIWAFLRTGSAQDRSFTIFFLVFMAVFEFLFSSLVGRLRRRCLIQSREEE